ncbi:hypothetical protein JCM10207_008773 [Rhodosporidiobolus poonsookiae]
MATSTSALSASTAPHETGPDAPLRSQDAEKPGEEESNPSERTAAASARSQSKEGAGKVDGDAAEELADKKVEKQRRWTIFAPFDFSYPPPPPATMDDAEEIKLAKANWLSETTFWWIQPLLVLGYKRELTATDLPKMDRTREAGFLADEFERNLAKRVKAVEEWNAALDSGEHVPSVWEKARWKAKAVMGMGREDGRREIGLVLALSDTFFWPFWSAGIYKVVADLAQTTSPLVTRQIIRFTQEAYAANQAGQPIPPIGKGVGLAVGLFFMQLIYSVGTNNTFSRCGQVGVLARAALIAAAYRKAMRMSPKARIHNTNAKLVSHISTSISRIEWAATFVHFSWTCIIQLIEIIVILLCTIGVTSLAGIAFVCISLPAQTWAMKQLFRSRQKTQVHTDDRIKTISELLSGIKIVKFFAWESPLLEKVANSRRKELGGLRKMLSIRAATQALALTIPTLASVVVFAVYAATGHTQDPAEIWTSLSLLNILRFPLMLLPNSLSTSADAYSALKNLIPVYTAEELPEDRVHVEDDLPVAIKVEQASFVWETAEPPASGGGRDKKGGKKAEGRKDKGAEEKKEGKEEKPSELLDINLEVARGELLCVVGSVGSGKSSLLQGLVGEMRKTSGSVTFGSRSIGYCAQSAWIFNATLRENILFGRDFEEKRYWECVRAASLLADFDQLPAGDMTEIGEKGINLSGGQRQRVSIARTLYFDADIILFDDPLSAVDAHVGAAIFENAIQGMLKEKTVVLVTHALQYLPAADNVLVMENGRIVERGHFDDLISANSSFSRFAREYGVTSAAEAKKEVKVAAKAEPKGEAAGGGPSNKPLMSKEEQASGTISLKTWRAYASAAHGIYTVPLLVLSLVAMGASQVLSNFSLVWWQNGTFGLGESGFSGLYAGLGISVAAATFIMGLATVWFGTAAARNLHHYALQRVVRAPTGWYDKTPQGRIINRFAKDTDSVDNRLNDSLRMCLATIAQLVASIVMIAIVYQWFLIPVAAIFIIYYFTSNFYRATARTIKRLDNNLRSFLYAWFSESLTGLSTIRAFGEQERYLRGLESTVDVENRAALLTVINQRWLAIRLDTMGALLTFVVAIVAVAERTSIPASQTGLILSTVLGMQQAVTMLVRQNAEVENNMASAERLIYFSKELEQEAPAVIPDRTTPPEWPQRGAISFQNAELRYRPELPTVLHDFSLEIKQGEKIGVVGRTGAGKSTLIQALFRIIELSQGRIEIDGLDIKSLGLQQLRQRLAIIPQEPVLFNGTIRSNLDPFSEYDDARLYDALRRSWLVDRTDNADGSGQASRFSLDSKVEDEGANMSVGERSLVSLARALVKDSKIVCLDEATASVDLETDSRIQATIRSEFKDKTLLTIAHRISTILSYDRILVMEHGRVDSFATPLELFDSEGIFSSLCHQSGISREDVVKAQEER